MPGAPGLRGRRRSPGRGSPRAEPDLLRNRPARGGRFGGAPFLRLVELGVTAPQRWPTHHGVGLLADIHDQFSYVLRIPCETAIPGFATSSNALPEKTFSGRDNGQFGYAMAAFGSNYFLASEPFFTKVEAGLSKRGSVSLYGLFGSLGTLYNPAGTNGAFGQALAAVDASRFVATAPANGLGNSSGRFHLGRISFQAGADGTALASLQVNATTLNPSPQLSDGFGLSAAAVGGKWIVVGAPRYDLGQTDAGRVYLFGVGTTNMPLVMTIPNPAPTYQANFGHAVMNRASFLPVSLRPRSADHQGQSSGRRLFLR